MIHAFLTLVHLISFDLLRSPSCPCQQSVSLLHPNHVQSEREREDPLFPATESHNQNCGKKGLSCEVSQTTSFLADIQAFLLIFLLDIFTPRKETICIKSYKRVFLNKKKTSFRPPPFGGGGREGKVPCLECSLCRVSCMHAEFFTMILVCNHPHIHDAARTRHTRAQH